MDLPTGTTFDRYVIEGSLGEGGMARVYRVRHQDLGTLHALKVLKMGAPSIQQRLRQEGRVQATFRHPNLVSVTDVVEVEGVPGIIMEFIEGPTLEALLGRLRPSPEEALALATGIINGVDYAHRLGLIHRDLKTANVLIAFTEAGPVPKITDFGLARLVTGEAGGGVRLTRSGQAMGTPSYMAPEQIRDAKSVDKRADIFSLGAIIYELYCGAQAFPGEDILSVFTAIATGNYRRPRDRVANLPDDVVRAIEGALAVKVADRIPDCEALLTTLRGSEPPGEGDKVRRMNVTWSEGMMTSIRQQPAFQAADARSAALSTWDGNARSLLLDESEAEVSRMPSDASPPSVHHPANRRWVAPAMVGAVLVMSIFIVVLALRTWIP